MRLIMSGLQRAGSVHAVHIVYICDVSEQKFTCNYCAINGYTVVCAIISGIVATRNTAD